MCNGQVFCDNINSRSSTIDNTMASNLWVDKNVYAVDFLNRSNESLKKNITKYKENALEIVKNSEIYQYNFKIEKDTNKKHIGFVIGDLGGKYKTPIEVVSENNNGINTYNMTSILWKAVQELSKELNQLQLKIKKEV